MPCMPKASAIGESNNILPFMYAVSKASLAANTSALLGEVAIVLSNDCLKSCTNCMDQPSSPACFIKSGSSFVKISFDLA